MKYTVTIKDCILNVLRAMGPVSLSDIYSECKTQQTEYLDPSEWTMDCAIEQALNQLEKDSMIRMCIGDGELCIDFGNEPIRNRKIKL